MEEPEQPAADREPGRHVKPEAEGPRRPVVDRDSGEQERKPDRNRDDRRPPAAIREQVENERPDRRGKDEDEEREPEPPQRDRCGHDCDQLEHEQPEVEAVEEDLVVVRVREPSEPVEDRAREDDEGGDRANREQPARDEVATDAGSFCCSGEDDEQEQCPEDEAPCAVLVGLDPEEREDRGRIVIPPR